MGGRNSKPKNNGPAGHPGRLDQFGAKLGSDNDEEFFAAADANLACDAPATPESMENTEPDH